MRSRLLLVLLIFSMIACMPSRRYRRKPDPFKETYLLREPTMNVLQDIDVKLDAYTTFALYPPSITNPSLEEKYFLYMLRNVFEAKGYKYVGLDENPDMVGTVFFWSEYKETYIPPQEVVVPVYEPGRTYTTTENSSGSVYGRGSTNYYTGSGRYAGSSESTGSASYSGQTRSTTTESGSVSFQRILKPGYTVGYYYPSGWISFFDGKTRKVIWKASGAGTSSSNDIRVSSQNLLARMVEQYPRAMVRAQQQRETLGVAIAILTVDGNNFYPAVLEIKSKGASNGFQDKDRIMAVDGRTTRNLPLSDFLSLVHSYHQAPFSLNVLRANGTTETILINKPPPSTTPTVVK